MLDLAIPAQRSTPELIADALRQAIFSGQLESGTPLKQNDVAHHFRVSAAPVREAFQKLVGEGLAAFQRNRGVVVASLSVADILDIAELRALLEAQAIRRSAPRLTAEDLTRAEAILRSATESTDRGTRANLHWQFHQLLYSKAQRPRLLASIESLFVNMNRYVMPAWDAVWLSEEWEDSHLRIVEAIRAGDTEEAARLIIEQIHEAAERVISRLQVETATQGKADESHPI